MRMNGWVDTIMSDMNTLDDTRPDYDHVKTCQLVFVTIGVGCYSTSKESICIVPFSINILYSYSEK